MRLLFLALVNLIFIQSLNPLYLLSQNDEFESPITPKDLPSLKDVGIFIGIGSNSQNGAFFTSCPCEFYDGTGAGFSFGVLYEQELIEKLRFGIDLGFNYKDITSTYIEVEPVMVTSQIDEAYQEKIKLSSRHHGDFNLTNIFARPYLKFFPFDFMYVKAGTGFAFVTSADVKHTQEVLQKTALLSTGELGIVSLLDNDGNSLETTSVVIEDNEYPNVNSLVLSIDFGIGFDFQLNKRFALSPSFEYYLPLNAISETGDNFKVSSWRIRMELRSSILSEEVLNLIYD